MRSVLSLVVASSLLVACSGSSDVRPDRLGVRRAPIMFGKPDTTHPAVVAVLGQSSLCTGTIIATKGAHAYVLTAAHCVQGDPPQEIVIGKDINQPSATFAVIGSSYDPAYDGDTHDFGMVKFSFAGKPAPPVIPVLLPADDAIHPGDDLVFVGYGVTESTQDNSIRNVVKGKVSSLDGKTISYGQQAGLGGPCNGDSGGPSLSVVNGVEHVSGTTSYGDPDCLQFGVSMRVSSAVSGFIQPFIDADVGGGSGGVSALGAGGGPIGAAGMGAGGSVVGGGGGSAGVGATGGSTGSGSSGSGSGGSSGGSGSGGGSGGSGSSSSGSSGGSSAKGGGPIASGGASAKGGAGGKAGGRPKEDLPVQPDGEGAVSCAVVGDGGGRGQGAGLMFIAVAVGMRRRVRRRT